MTLWVLEIKLGRGDADLDDSLRNITVHSTKQLAKDAAEFQLQCDADSSHIEWEETLLDEDLVIVSVNKYENWARITPTLLDKQW